MKRSNFPNRVNDRRKVALRQVVRRIADAQSQDAKDRAIYERGVLEERIRE